MKKTLLLLNLIFFVQFALFAAGVNVGADKAKNTNLETVIPFAPQVHVAPTATPSDELAAATAAVDTKTDNIKFSLKQKVLLKIIKKKIQKLQGKSKAAGDLNSLLVTLGLIFIIVGLVLLVLGLITLKGGGYGSGGGLIVLGLLLYLIGKFVDL